MNVVTRRRLREFWAIHPRAEGPLTAWYEITKRAQWRNPNAVRTDFGSVDFLADNRVIFDIGGNKYRLVVRISYEFKQVLVKFVGTHSDYDKIDPTTV
ncbi:MAG TPA: type II toxin-antitoxin system HigB family toxin [Caulobacteraceae bacterium]|nr:type II toxin-antitoxin system HigB family toxin [Caulobacteraceae bacterium]